MSKRKPPENGELLNKLAELPASAPRVKLYPFRVLTSDQQEEWLGVKRSYLGGELDHVSITQLKRAVLKHFGMVGMSFDKFKKELEKSEDN